MSVQAPTADPRLAAEVIAGLRRTPKTLPAKLFYDERGAALFQEITAQPEYYPTRLELSILRESAPEIRAWAGAGARIIEFGSGSGEKTRLLLRHLHAPAEYVPIDIAGQQLSAFAARLRTEFPALVVTPIVADYTRRPALPPPRRARGRTIVFFPGSTIGNLEPPDAARFLRDAAAAAGTGGGLLIGVDLKKDAAVIERAYNDDAGVTAEFNLNILNHVNRLFAGTFEPSRFRHHAFYNSSAGRIEMHLISTESQRVTLETEQGAEVIDLAEAEPIVTEHSYKYAEDEFRELAAHAGFTWRETWTDAARMFGVLAFDVAPAR